MSQNRFNNRLPLTLLSLWIYQSKYALLSLRIYQSVYEINSGTTQTPTEKYNWTKTNSHLFALLSLLELSTKTWRDAAAPIRVCNTYILPLGPPGWHNCRTGQPSQPTNQNAHECDRRHCTYVLIGYFHIMGVVKYFWNTEPLNKKMYKCFDWPWPNLPTSLNSMCPDNTYKRQWAESSLVQKLLRACSAPSHQLNHCWHCLLKHREINRTKFKPKPRSINIEFIMFITVYVLHGFMGSFGMDK